MWFLLNYDVRMCAWHRTRASHVRQCIGCKQKLKGNREQLVRVYALCCCHWSEKKWRANTIGDLKYDSHSRNVAHTRSTQLETVRLRYSSRSIDEVHTILSARNIVLVLPLQNYIITTAKHIYTTQIYTTFILFAEHTLHTVTLRMRACAWQHRWNVLHAYRLCVLWHKFRRHSHSRQNKWRPIFNVSS